MAEKRITFREIQDKHERELAEKEEKPRRKPSLETRKVQALESIAESLAKLVQADENRNRWRRASTMNGKDL